MPKAAIGWRPHTGWAVLVVVRGTATRPTLLERRRVELVHGEQEPRFAYHYAQQQGLPAAEAKKLVARVQRASTKSAVETTRAIVNEFAVDAIGVVGKPRRLPDDLERILASHTLLHAAEGALFEGALVDAAARVGVPATMCDPKRLVVGDALDAMRATLGPPWQRDHKLAAAAAFAALKG